MNRYDCGFIWTFSLHVYYIVLLLRYATIMCRSCGRFRLP